MRTSAKALSASQTWFARAITTPEDGTSPALAGAWSSLTEPGRESRPTGAGEAPTQLTAGPRMTALERLEVYRGAYHRRLVECLADDYPALRFALGEPAFEGLCRGYIARHPSGSPSLNAYGAGFPGFCRSEAADPFPARSFAADLTSLEWAIVEVIHSPARQALALERLEQVPPERWAEARMVVTPALRILRLRHPANAYYGAFVRGEASALPSPAPSCMVVHRSGPSVWRMDLSEPMLAVLEALAHGQGLLASLERASEYLAGEDEEAAGQRVMGWFREWVRSGLFADVRLDGGPRE